MNKISLLTLLPIYTGERWEITHDNADYGLTISWNSRMRDLNSPFYKMCNVHQRYVKAGDAGPSFYSTPGS